MGLKEETRLPGSLTILFFSYAGIDHVRFNGYILRFFAETLQKREYTINGNNVPEWVIYLVFLHTALKKKGD
jgi:hypothetical protein